jgi:two-component system NarL family sensor kinase
MALVPVIGGTAPASPGAGAAAVTAPAPRQGRRVASLLLGAVPVVEVALAVGLWSAAGYSFAYLLAGHQVQGAVVALAFATVGAVAIGQRPRHRLGWLFLLIGHLEALAVLTDAYSAPSLGLPGAGTAQWLTEWLWIPGWIACLGLLIPLFPDGRPRSPLWSLLAKAGLTLTLLGSVLTLLLPDAVPHTPVPAPVHWQGALGLVVGACLAGVLLCWVVGTVGLAVRAARTTESERRRILWFFTGFTVFVVTTVVPLGGIVQLIGTVVFPVAIGIAMLRYGLFDADRLLSRTLLYAGLSLLVAAAFAICVAISLALAGNSGFGVALAAVVVTVGLSPARDRVQRGVDRLLYGERRDPYAAMTGLGSKLSAALDPPEMLGVVVGTVTEALRLPYAAISVGDDPVPAAFAGRSCQRAKDLPLQHAGEAVGVLTVGLRDGALALDASDERLLADVARQAGAVAHAVRLSRDVQLAHERLLTARDEERNRIRRDMHDQLGPLLAGVALGLGAARRDADHGLPGQAEVLGRLQSQLQAGLDDVKRLIADLRPSDLDELGLVAALDRHARVLSAGDAVEFDVQVVPAGPIPALPSEVEVAAYRICLEALTNAVRHGRASRARVGLELQEASLLVVVEDDGIGLPEHGRRAGVGLASMTARAQDLGGSCTIGPRPSGGTVVTAALPLGGPA